jgi:hypothetical protein
MMQYQNGLIGKHFKTLMQTMVFHVHDIVSPDQFMLIKPMGALRAVLWVPETDNMDQYLVSNSLRSAPTRKNVRFNIYQMDLEILIGNILDVFALIDPAKIIDKMKLQVLLHLVDDIRQFGPAI